MEHVSFIFRAVDNFYVVEVPCGAEPGVVVPYPNLVDLSQVCGFNFEYINLEIYMRRNVVSKDAHREY